MTSLQTQIQQNLANLKYFKDRENTDLAYAFEVNSGKPGKHILIVGGVHGHEPVGVEAIIEVSNRFENGDLKLESGKITFLLGNPNAYKINKRLINQNLNRAFLEDLESGVEGIRASAIRGLFDNSKIDFVLDLHTVSQGEFQMLAVYSQISVQTALKISDLRTIVILHESNTPGTLALEGERREIPGLMVECGNNISLQALPIAVRHILQTLRHFDCIYSTNKSVSFKQINFHDCVNIPLKVIVYRVLEPIKPDINFRFANPQATTGTLLRLGEEFAFGDNNKYFAPQDCVLFIPDHNPSPLDNDAGFLALLEVS